MLRLRKNLQPRIPDHLAVLSAILLLVSAFANSSHTLQGNQDSPLLTEFTEVESREMNAAAREAQKLAARKAANISLMIFRPNK